ncbi:Uu.00g124820.m01.CDS01 [Anthostomella pinea]|uniref:Uu.00g124820.m01.CDS01 n=1 Tax=Anthostomella pinea TaxID=933095 RepID=A0AAI8VHP8_9PEZI|nr:Uu.00g124820.m01.CDS01 [Anthostomella pinea]
MAATASETALSPFDRLMPRVYVRQILCFPSTDPNALRALKDGLAGVALDDLFTGNNLSSHIEYAQLKADNFPPAALMASGIVPADTQPPYPDPAPVFRARLSLVKGGFLLCIALHHSTTDITGFDTLLKIWASNCRAGSFRPVGFDPSWMDRRVLLEPHNTTRTPPHNIPGLLHIQTPAEASRRVTTRSSSEEWQTAIFYFPQRGLRDLKRKVNELLVSDGTAGWVSTWDALTTLLWGAVLGAELNDHDHNPTTTHLSKATSTIGFPVDFRSKLHPPLPQGYLGAAFAMTSATALRDDIISLSNDAGSSSVPAVARVATAIRASLNRVNDASVRDTLAYLNHNPDQPSIILGPPHDGISIVSWADQSVYELDWGVAVGRCDAVRLPKLPNKRYPIVLPRVPDVGDDGGGLEVIICLEKSVMERFASSGPIARYAVLRCIS